MAKKLNEVTKVTTMNENDYAVLNAADGSIVQIKKSDLANALVEVMRTVTTEKNGLMSTDHFMLRESILDANKALLNGIYVFTFDTKNTPVSNYYICTVFKTTTYILQNTFGLNNGRAWYRFSIDRGVSWNNWKEFATI